MGRLFLIELDGRRHYSCKLCDVALALYRDVISKSSRTRNGDAYVFENVVNITTGEPEVGWIMYASGLYMLSDIFCVKCGSLVGFKCVTAFQDGEKYRENRFIVERDKVYGHYILTHDGRLLGTDDDECGESDEFGESDESDESGESDEEEA